MTAPAPTWRQFLTVKASAILGVTSLLGLWIAAASSQHLPAQLTIALAIAMGITASLGLVAGASPHAGSVMLRLVGAVLSLAGLVIGVLLVMGLGI